MSVVIWLELISLYTTVRGSSRVIMLSTERKQGGDVGEVVVLYSARDIRRLGPDYPGYIPMETTRIRESSQRRNLNAINAMLCTVYYSSLRSRQPSATSYTHPPGLPADSYPAVSRTVEQDV